MQDPNAKAQEFKPVVLDPTKRPTKPEENDGNRATTPTVTQPDAKPEIKKV